MCMMLHCESDTGLTLISEIYNISELHYSNLSLIFKSNTVHCLSNLTNSITFSECMRRY